MKISTDALDWALKHLTRDRDTDLFPRLFEFAAVQRFKDQVFAALRRDSITNHVWVQGRRFVVPRGSKRHRAATQLDPIDSLMISALIYEVVEKIEAHRLPEDQERAFSYRTSVSDSGQLYAEPSGWRSFWEHSAEKAATAHTVLAVDIRDFYNQIYHHTIENELKSAGVSSDHSKAIVGCLARQSHSVSRGIPIGPHFTHIIAELCLNPIDRALLSNGLDFCRYADDFHIFCESEEDAELALTIFVETLDKQQRLALNDGKTHFWSSAEFIEHARSLTEDQPLNKQEEDLLAVIREYTEDDDYSIITYQDADFDALDEVSEENLTELIEGYLDETPTNWSRLGWLLRRLRQVGAPGALRCVVKNLTKLTPVIGDASRYILSAAPNFKDDPRSIGSDIARLLQGRAIRSSEYVSCILSHLFAVNRDFNHVNELTKIWPDLRPSAKREILVAAAQGKEHAWLRERKDDVGNLDPWSERALIVALSGLPDEEAKFWIKNKAPSLDGLNRLVAARFFDQKFKVTIGGDIALR